MVGVAVTVAAVAELKLPAGDQAYVEPPETLITADWPWHISWLAGVTTGTGIGTTLTVTVVNAEHPPFDPVTVYTVVAPGLAITDVPVDVLSDAEGVHV